MRASVVASVLLLTVIAVLGAPLRGDGAPLGIVSLQFAVSPEEAAAILAAWADVARSRLLWAHGLDLVLPFAYALAVGLAALRIREVSPAARRAAGLAAGSVVVAAVADQVENVAMAVSMLVRPSGTSVAVTFAAATVKSVLLAVALGALALAAVLRSRAEGATR